MKPIQFNIPTGMLQAVLEGRKTQTCLPLSTLQKEVLGKIDPETFEDEIDIPDFAELSSIRKSKDFDVWQLSSFDDPNRAVFRFWNLPKPDLEDYDEDVDNLEYEDWQLVNQYHVGEVLAVVEPFYLDYWGEPNFNMDFFKGDWAGEELGDPNKFPADLARNFVKITGIQVKKPELFSKSEIKAEGMGVMTAQIDLGYDITRQSFRSLFKTVFDSYYHEGAFQSEMLVIQFRLCNKEGVFID